jgi:hypothetical protein
MFKNFKKNLSFLKVDSVKSLVQTVYQPDECSFKSQQQKLQHSQGGAAMDSS